MYNILQDIRRMKACKIVIDMWLFSLEAIMKFHFGGSLTSCARVREG